MGKDKPMFKVFIDGQEGTTGLKIFNRLSAREDIQLLHINPLERKDLKARLQMIDEADITFLCLPDSAAREVAELAPEHKKIIDASTAHRTMEGWVYGFPEIDPDQKRRIRECYRVSVPGCHASGFIATLKPLIHHKVIQPDTYVSCTSITGYSGGGKAMISEYENGMNKEYLYSPRVYGLTQTHKHLPEMARVAGLEKVPAFVPIVSNYYSGMLTTVVLDAQEFNKKMELEEIRYLFRQFYKDQIMVKLVSEGYEDDGGMISSEKMSGRDDMELLVAGNDQRIQLNARYDNLGKGASGAAIQCMNIMLGLEETTGLVKG